MHRQCPSKEVTRPKPPSFLTLTEYHPTHHPTHVFSHLAVFVACPCSTLYGTRRVHKPPTPLPHTNQQPHTKQSQNHEVPRHLCPGISCSWLVLFFLLFFACPSFTSFHFPQLHLNLAIIMVVSFSSTLPSPSHSLFTKISIHGPFFFLQHPLPWLSLPPRWLPRP